MTETPSSPPAARLAQAKLFAEVASRIDNPPEALPRGDASLVSVLLWQQAAAWAISAADGTAQTAVDGERSEAERQLLERCAGSGELLEAVVAMIRNRPATPDADASAAAARATTLASFTTRLIAELERPLHGSRQERRSRLVWIIATGAGAAFALGSLLFWLFRPANLVPKSTRSLSSQFSTCSAGECGTAIFHTNEEASPWVRYDFGSQKELHSINVENRRDCCFERAAPLIVESSNDARRWTELVRTEQSFVTWSADLHGRARYVRLRVGKKSFLHLRKVVIR